MPLNKRKHARTPVHIGSLPSAKMTLYKPFYHEPFEVEILDLSAGGMKLVCPEILPLYFEFGLEFQLPGTNVIQAKAKALHQMRNGDSYDVGVLFTEIEEGVRNSLTTMGKDFEACEERIRKEEKEICLPSCSFLPLCQKPQKKS